MKAFKAKRPYTVIIGCGRLGANIANSLSDKGEDVLVVDSNRSSFCRLLPSFGGLTLTGDATDLDVLAEARLPQADAIVIVTNNDNINIMTAQLVKEFTSASRIIARLYNPDCECVYREFGIDTICPAVLSAKEIDSILDSQSKAVGI